MTASALESLALVEVGAMAAALVMADRLGKAAGARLLGIENTDAGTLCLRFGGTAADVEEMGRAARAIADRLRAPIVVSVRPRVEAAARALALAPPMYSPILEAPDGLVPGESTEMKESIPAIGLLETQGLVVNLHACDVMLKTATVRVVGKEKIGGGYVTILVAGELAAVKAAIDAGRTAVLELGGPLILADVISRPHADLLALLPNG